MALMVGSASMGDGACCHMSYVKVYGGQGKSLGWNSGQRWFCGTGYSTAGVEAHRQDISREALDGRLSDVYVLNSGWIVHSPSRWMCSL